MFTGGGTYRDIVMCPVRIKLNNDEILLGVIEKPRTKSLLEFLCADVPFFSIELYDGNEVNVAKRAILSCRENDLPKADQLKVSVMKADIYDPFCVLGLEPGAKRDEIRQAYIGLARKYHPDRYEGLELPQEMADYVLAMTKRLNIAFNDANERIDDLARKKGRSGSGSAAAAGNAAV